MHDIARDPDDAAIVNAIVLLGHGLGLTVTAEGVESRAQLEFLAAHACDEVQGTFALTIEGRGFGSRVVASHDESFLESECVSCGACVESCPTAALSEKPLAIMGRPEKAVTTTCAYCGVGCSFEAEVKGEQVVRMVPSRDGKANRGHACVKGRFAYGYATHADRITTPMIRRQITDPWQPVKLGRGVQVRRVRIPAHPGTARTRVGRREHLFRVPEALVAALRRFEFGARG